MKILVLSLLFASGLCRAAAVLPDAYVFSYTGTQESNGLHATVAGGFSFNAPGQTDIGLSDLTSFNLTLLETPTLFPFTETTYELGLSDVENFALDIPSNLLTMTVQIFDDPNVSPLFATFRVFPPSAIGINSSIPNLGEVGLALAEFYLTPSPEPVTYVLIGIGLIGLMMSRRCLANRR
jgi:hypothetical protein